MDEISDCLCEKDAWIFHPATLTRELHSLFKMCCATGSSFTYSLHSLASNGTQTTHLQSVLRDRQLLH